MFPRKTEWSSWTAIEKVTYVAQILAPFSLLITVFFSYLSWQTQLTIFKSQSSPSLKLHSLYIEDSALIFPIKNTGGSEALDVCVALHEIPRIERLDERCIGEIKPNNTKEYRLELNERFQEVIQYTPTSLGLLRFGNKLNCESSSRDIIAFDISYSGAFGIDDFESISIYICK